MFLKQTSNSLPLSPCPLSPGKGDFTGATAPDQARMLAVSRTKPLHDAVAQMADDLYGGYAPATPFLSTIEVFRQSAGKGFPLSFFVVYIKLICFVNKF